MPISQDYRKLHESLNELTSYIESEGYRGYDPYDTLMSFIPFQWLGKWGPIIAIQFQKRNPLNIRPPLGIPKDINPKAIGLLLDGYSVQYQLNSSPAILQKAENLFQWLKTNYSNGYSGPCWGYNFPWASPEKYLNPFVPSAVVTGFIVRGIFRYYQISRNPLAAELIVDTARFVMQDLAHYEDGEGICISYTPIKQDFCFNASLLAAEILARAYTISNEPLYKEIAAKAVDWVVKRQHMDGRWNYSLDPSTGKEREQIDFHQGYVVDSICEIKDLLHVYKDSWDNGILKGASYYYRHQFFGNGRSLWRIPKEYPTDIHNQAQGIITFAKLAGLQEEYVAFSEKIALWTIDHMKSKKGYFYYRNYKMYSNRIPYMRWSQAWMFLALTVLIQRLENQK